MSPAARRIGRRTVLAGAGLAAALTPAPASASGHRGQAGITEGAGSFLALAGFDLKTRQRAQIGELLQRWSSSARRPATQEHIVTIGFGPSLFARTPGLSGRRPDELRDLPAFAGEAIDEAASHGDICVQVCAPTPTAAADGLRSLVNSGRTWAQLRWRHLGYREADGTPDPRNPFRFRDGTVNPAVDDLATGLWVSSGPSWLHGGTYLVMRRIRLLLDTWDRTPLAQQEAMIGRTRARNQRIRPVAERSHVSLAAAGNTMLRRSYTYDAGVDVNGLQDSGLIFLSYQKDPGRQFVPVQQRLAEHDPLNAFSQHTATGVFACPPRPELGSWLGEGLFA